MPLVALISLLMSSAAHNQTPQAGAQDTGRIRGRIVAAQTGEPLRGAQVTLSGDAMPVRATSTDADGRYEFAQLPAGAFYVSATETGYISMAYGQRRPLESGTPVAVQEGQTVDRIDLALPRAGAITVRVTDDAGEPLAGAQVQVQRFQYAPDGQRRLTNVPMGIRGRAATDDRGEVRAFGLMPGEYVISATVRTIGVARGANPDDTAEGFSPTYYPGTVSADQAQVVALGIGEETAVQVAMVVSRLSRVSGTVFTSDGRPAAGAQLQVATRTGSGGNTYGAGAVAPDGTFAIVGVPPGEHSLEVRQNNTRARYEAITRAAETGVLDVVNMDRGEFASVPLTVTGDDIPGLRIVTSAGTTISGKVVFEGTSPPLPTPELRVFTLPPGSPVGAFAFVGTPGEGPRNGPVGADGRFQITGVSDRVLFNLPAPGWVLKSVTHDGQNITDDPLDLTGRTSISDVVITLTDKVSSVTGQVSDGRGQLARNYVVVLLPADPMEPARASRWIHTAHPNTDGRFQMRGVRPGRYLAAAIEALEQGRQYAPEFQQQLRRGAREFTVREGESVTLDLRLTPDP